MKRSKLPIALLLMTLFATPLIAQDAEQDESYKRKHRMGTRNFFSADFGINNWLEDGKSPSDNNALYEVRPWGSWYIGLNAMHDTHITGNLHLHWGLGVSWYNFKFENEATRMSEGNDEIIFSEAPLTIDSDKSKLTTTHLNVTMVPMLKFGSSRYHYHRSRWNDWEPFERHEGGFRIGLGAYAGYKIDSYTKVVADDDKDRDHDGFYLNNLRYGARLQAGFRGLDVFVNYDLNEVFADNKGPKLNAFSFGVIL